MRNLFTGALASAFFASGALSTSTNTSSNLVVKTRTGTFVGGLNDTYPNVRQFKYVPYAKVTWPPFRFFWVYRADLASLAPSWRLAMDAPESS
jgi:hypothetical protein